MTTAPDMLREFGGAPVSGGRFTNPWTKHYFVDATDGATSNGGLRTDDALTTIQAAVTLATAGDVIYVRPQTYKLGTGFNRYEEDVTVTLGGDGGSGVVATNANISLIGVSQRGKPSDFLGVRWKKGSATHLTIDAPCFHVENIGFFSEDATYAINLRCNGATRTQEGTTGFSIYNCAIKGDGKIYANGGNEVQIVNCRFQTKYDGTVGGIEMVGSSNAVQRPLIQGCEFIGGNANNMSAACIVGAAPWQDAVIRDNFFNADSDTSIYISIAGSTSTGIISNNHFGVADISTGRIVEGGLIATGAYDGGGLSTAT